MFFKTNFVFYIYYSFNCLRSPDGYSGLMGQSTSIFDNCVRSGIPIFWITIILDSQQMHWMINVLLTDLKHPSIYQNNHSQVLVSISVKLTTMAHFESNYSSYYCNYMLIRTSIVATIVLLEINGGSKHRYSSRLSGSLL